MSFKTLRYILIQALILVSVAGTFGQTKDSLPSDSSKLKTKLSFVARMQQFAEKSAKSSIDDFEGDKAAIAQNRILEEIKKKIQKAKSFLKNGVDTLGTKAKLISLNEDFTIAKDGVLTNKGSSQTFRNLTTTSKILTELLNKANASKAKLDLYQSEVNRFRYDLDSLLSQRDLFKFSSDSATLSKFMGQLVVAAYEVNPVDSSLKKENNSIQGMLNQVNLQVFKIETGLEEIERYKQDIARNTFYRDFDNIWGKVAFYRPFSEILNQAQAKGLLTLVFYLQNNIGKLAILLLIISAAFIYLRSLKSIYEANKLTTDNYEGQRVLRYPFWSALLISVSLFQFMFFSPPFILSVIFWLISSLSLTMIFRGFITKYWINVWLLMAVFFIISALDNLILQASRTERWLMLALSLTGSIVGLMVLLKGRKEELREKLILIAIGLMVFLELASSITNIFGRYNLSKALLISGFLDVVVAILFLWTIRLINEGLFLAFNVYTKQDPKLFYLNFEKVGKKVPVAFYLLLIFGWIILFGRNFAGFEYASAPFRDFFARERTIGDYSFTINSLLLFILIMGISVATSKIVSFFASDKHQVQDDKSKNALQSVGSWLLLIRIGILSLGLFLAVAAAGIPVDRITIVLGALGVGIGFGLQALVNNLVSGLIIAFEKPVNVGDIIEIDGQGGTMKSIGFRSSVISTWDGADVIMPNGDLLNSHLINWSMGGSKRRTLLSIGVAYDSNLEKVKEILTQTLDGNPNVIKTPPPSVNYEQFGNSSIDIKVFFWTKHFREATQTKSELIIAINDAFKSADIKIPYPQQDITIYKNEDFDKRK